MAVNPRCYQQAQGNTNWSQWDLAMKVELAEMDIYQVWTTVGHQLIASRKTLDSRWGYTWKIDDNTGRPAA
jgi:hypothetical protein